MTDWVDVEEDVPMIEKGYRNVSREVECLLKGGTVVNGFFQYSMGKWFNADTGNKIPERNRVIAWTDK